jgi:hypothetical protein
MAILYIKHHFELQEVLVEYVPLLHLINKADVIEECYYSPLRTVLDQTALVLP